MKEVGLSSEFIIMGIFWGSDIVLAINIHHVLKSRDIPLLGDFMPVYAGRNKRNFKNRKHKHNWTTHLKEKLE